MALLKSLVRKICSSSRSLDRQHFVAALGFCRPRRNRRMADVLLNVGDDLTGIGLVPAPVQVLSAVRADGLRFWVTAANPGTD